MSNMTETKTAFESALTALVSADSQNSNKSNQLKEWFSSHFSQAGRGSYVTEKKQAYNRPPEQFKHKDAHVVFVYNDAGTVSVLLNKIKDLLYSEYKTVALVHYDGTNFSAKHIFHNGQSSVLGFFRDAYPQIDCITWAPGQNNETRPPELADDDSLFDLVKSLLADGHSNIIFTGPPGTSKSWYASAIANKLASGNTDNVFYIQFHASYQYEDFMEGFTPVAGGGFKLTPKHFLNACEKAKSNPNNKIILIVDELSRVDVGRVFGEALSYIEPTKRGVPFLLSSGTRAVVPPNLHIIATMNPFDKGVDEVDSAVERRFALIDMPPNANILERILSENGMEDGLLKATTAFFKKVNGSKNPFCRIGHAYFLTCKDAETLTRLWNHQLKFQIEKMYRRDLAGLGDIQGAWDQIFKGESSSSEGWAANFPTKEIPQTPSAPELKS